MQYLQQIILTPILDVVTLTKKYLKEHFDKSNCYWDAGFHQIRFADTWYYYEWNSYSKLYNMKIESIKEISQLKADKETEYDFWYALYLGTKYVNQNVKATWKQGNTGCECCFNFKTWMDIIKKHGNSFLLYIYIRESGLCKTFRKQNFERSRNKKFPIYQPYGYIFVWVL